MDQNGPKNDPNFAKWSKKDQNCPKWIKMAPKRTKMEDPFGAKWFKMAQKGPELPKMDQNGPKKGPK